MERIVIDILPLTALPRTSIEVVMDGLIRSVDCPDCRQVLKDHVHELVTKWMLLEVSVSPYVDTAQHGTEQFLAAHHMIFSKEKLPGSVRPADKRDLVPFCTCNGRGGYAYAAP